MRSALFAAAALSLLAGVAEARTVAVTADRLVDVATGKVAERPLVIITDGRITSVGKQGDQFISLHCAPSSSEPGDCDEC